jgi:hypothetical protein
MEIRQNFIVRMNEINLIVGKKILEKGDEIIEKCCM